MIDERRQQEIEDYLRSRMSAEQKTAFEEELKTNKELAREVAMVRLEMEAGMLLMEKELLDKFKSWKLPDEPTEKKRSGNWSAWLLVALLTLLVGALAYWLYSKQDSSDLMLEDPTSKSTEAVVTPSDTLSVDSVPTPPTPDDNTETSTQAVNPTDPAPRLDSFALLAVQLYPKDALPEFSSNNNLPQFLQNALAAYRRQDWERALRLLGRPVAGDAHYFTIQEMIGRVQFEKGDFLLAKDAFSKVAQQEGQSRQELNKGLLLLSMLALGERQNKEFDDLFGEIVVNSNHASHSLAVRLGIELSRTTRRPPAVAMATGAYQTALARQPLDRGRRGSEEDPLKAALAAFQQGAWQAAVDSARAYLNDEDYRLPAEEITAHALFNMDRFVEATPLFGNQSQSIPPFQQNGEGYLLLCLLAQGLENSTVFKDISDKIRSNPRHSFHDQAEAIQNAIQESFR